MVYVYASHVLLLGGEKTLDFIYCIGQHRLVGSFTINAQTIVTLKNSLDQNNSSIHLN